MLYTGIMQNVADSGMTPVQVPPQEPVGTMPVGAEQPAQPTTPMPEQPAQTVEPPYQPGPAPAPMPEQPQSAEPPYLGPQPTDEQPIPDEEPPYYQDPQTGQFFPGWIKPPEEELVYAWTAPDRPFKKRKKQFFMTASTIAALISLILFFSGQFPLIGVVVAVLFVTYMLYTFPPHTITNQITTFGIRSIDSLYYWEELGSFWFETKMGQEVLLIEVSRFPNRLNLLIGEGDKTTITAIISEILLQNKPPLTPVEKAAQWLQDKIPLDLDE